MKAKTKRYTLVKILAVGGFLASACSGQSADDQESAAGGAEGYTFRLTSLTKPPIEFQPGIQTIITLNMIENGGSKAVRINDPPPFPLVATLEYEAFDGQKRKVSSSYGYRC
jgi:hypothetical protein